MSDNKTIDVASEVDVLVVGAGPAGLTAAYSLLKKTGDGISVAVLEENPVYVGGISRTEGKNGYLFDIGGHRFFSKAKEVEDFWREVLPDDFLERPRTSRIYYGGKFYSYPLRAFEALGNLGLFQSAVCVLSYLYARLFPTQSPKTFHAWVANNFGERLYRIFFKTYTEKVWGMDCDEISADWAAQRIKGLSLFTAAWQAVRKSLGVGHSGKTIKTLIESFRYPRRGPGMMWEAVASQMKAMGGQLHMGVAARQFQWNKDAGRWTVSAQAQDGQSRVWRARHVISSAPMREVVMSVEPRPRCADQVAHLRYRDFLTVAIMLKSPPMFDDNWIYIHDESVKVGRIQNYSSWSPEMVPDASTGCLGLEYFCFEGDGLWDAPDSELVTLAIKELSALKLATADQVIDGCVVRQKKAYPVYDAIYKDIVESVREEFATQYPTLHFVGRNGMHKYNNQDHAMMTAMLTAENIIAASSVYDVWAVNEDAEYHEAGSAGHQSALNSLRAVPEEVKR